jgi:hypothetical protein
MKNVQPDWYAESTRFNEAAGYYDKYRPIVTCFHLFRKSAI